MSAKNDIVSDIAVLEQDREVERAQVEPNIPRRKHGLKSILILGILGLGSFILGVLTVFMFASSKSSVANNHSLPVRFNTVFGGSVGLAQIQSMKVTSIQKRFPAAYRTKILIAFGAMAFLMLLVACIAVLHISKQSLHENEIMALNMDVCISLDNDDLSLFAQNGFWNTVSGRIVVVFFVVVVAFTSIVFVKMNQSANVVDKRNAEEILDDIQKLMIRNQNFQTDTILNNQEQNTFSNNEDKRSSEPDPLVYTYKQARRDIKAFHEAQRSNIPLNEGRVLEFYRKEPGKNLYIQCSQEIGDFDINLCDAINTLVKTGKLRKTQILIPHLRESGKVDLGNFSAMTADTHFLRIVNLAVKEEYQPVIAKYVKYVLEEATVIHPSFIKKRGLNLIDGFMQIMKGITL